MNINTVAPIVTMSPLIPAHCMLQFSDKKDSYLWPIFRCNFVYEKL